MRIRALGILTSAEFATDRGRSTSVVAKRSRREIVIVRGTRKTHWVSVVEIVKKTRILMEFVTTRTTALGLMTSVECVTDRERSMSVVAKRCRRKIVIVKGT